MTLDQFIAKYQGRKGVGTNPSDMGECGGLYNVGTEEMWGLRYPIRDVLNMGDLLKGRNTQPDKVEIVFNNPDPNHIPKRGDAVVFMPGPTGNPVGHVGWVTASGTKQMSIFDQSQGIACAIRNYSYNNVKGWVRFKGDEMLTRQKIIDTYLVIRGSAPSEAEISAHLNGGTMESLVNGFKKEADGNRANVQKALSDLQTALQNEKNKPPVEVIKTVEKIVEKVVEKEVVKEVEPAWLVKVRDFILRFLNKKG